MMDARIKSGHDDQNRHDDLNLHDGQNLLDLHIMA
jgi:hypothetical protein